MASGFGYNGGTSRCFTFWQEFQKCYASADTPSDCIDQKEDYLECLHHTKEIARAKQIKEQYLIQQHRLAKEQREKGEERATGGIMRLGLIENTEDTPSEDGGEKLGSPAQGGLKNRKQT